jgi:spermidine synthase
MRSWQFHLLAFASGFLALVYEVLWMRSLAILFGATVPAAAATLAAFFLGIALGSGILGKRAAGWSHPLRAYGLMELGIAAGAILAQQILRTADLHYQSMYTLLSGLPAVFLAAKIALTMLALLVPTFLMGGLLPALAQAMAADRGRLGVEGGGLYSINTLGAALGALSVPYLLLPALGSGWSYLASVGGSIVLGIAAWVMSGANAGGCTSKPEKDSPKTPMEHAKVESSLPVFAFLSGFLLLALEVFWTRMFALVHQNSIYSFSLVVAVFLLGLAGGAVLARELLRRGFPIRFWLVAAWYGSGLLVFLSPRLFLFLSSGMTLVEGGTGAYGVLLIAMPIILPVTLISGTILPLLMELAGGRRGIPAGPALGRLLALNTLGSILGPLLAVYMLTSRVGLWWNIALVGVALLFIGETTRHIGSPRRTVRILPVYGFLGAAIWLLGPGGLPQVHIQEGSGERVVSLEECGYGSVAVVEGNGHRWMTLNNYYILGGTASVRDERMQAHLPLLLHPAPQKVAFLGLGTGITAGAALLHPVDSIVALEMVPEIAGAAREYFADANLHVLDNPRIEVVYEDARNFLKGSGRKFDLIIGDLVVPWRPGESSLLTIEHFRATREALLPGGMFCQWLPLFQLSEDGFRIVARTFLQVYPKAMLWRGDFLADQPAVALIGQRDPSPLHARAIDRRVRELAARVEDTNPYLADPSGLWLHLLGILDSSDPRYVKARLNGDGRPWLELLAPAGHLEGSPFRTGELEAALFEEARRVPLKGTPLEGLDSEHLRWREAGNDLWRASILAAEARDEESRAMAMEALRSLPQRLQEAVLGRRPE